MTLAEVVAEIETGLVVSDDDAAADTFVMTSGGLKTLGAQMPVYCRCPDTAVHMWRAFMLAKKNGATGLCWRQRPSVEQFTYHQGEPPHRITDILFCVYSRLKFSYERSEEAA